MPILQVEHIRKSFGQTKVLDDISFSMEPGDTLSIIGSSGSGKTTLLRCLNFLEKPEGARAAQKAAALWPGVPVFQPFSAVHGTSERDAGGGTAGA